MGWLLVVLGVCLSVGIAVVASSLHHTIVHGSDPGARSHWNGSPEFTRSTFELFGAVFVFGLAGLGASVRQVSTGRRSRTWMGLLLLALAAIVYLGYGILSGAVPER